jgi:multiple sugar transport system permease protein
MLIFLAGLQGIPIELHESAEIDGAGAWGRFWRITVPLLSPSIFFNLILGVIGALQMFTLAYIATSGGGQSYPAGGPVYSTLFYVLNLYNHAFDYWEMGYASALAWVFFLMVLILTYVQLRTARSWVYYEAEVGAVRW